MTRYFKPSFILIPLILVLLAAFAAGVWRGMALNDRHMDSWVGLSGKNQRKPVFDTVERLMPICPVGAADKPPIDRKAKIQQRIDHLLTVQEFKTMFSGAYQDGDTVVFVYGGRFYEIHQREMPDHFRILERMLSDCIGCSAVIRQ